MKTLDEVMRSCLTVRGVRPSKIDHLVAIEAAILDALENPHRNDFEFFDGVAQLVEYYDSNVATEGEPRHTEQVKLLNDLYFLRKLTIDSYSSSDPLKNALEAVHKLAGQTQPDNLSYIQTGLDSIRSATVYCLNNGYHKMTAEGLAVSKRVVRLILPP